MKTLVTILSLAITASAQTHIRARDVTLVNSPTASTKISSNATAPRTVVTPDANSVTVQPLTCTVSQVLNGVSAAGVLTCTIVSDSDLSTTDITTNNVSISKHGFIPKLPNDATVFLNGVGGYSTPTFTVPHYFAYGGSGLDSALAFDGVTTIPCATLGGSTYTLTRECYGTTITVSNGVTVNMNNAGQCYIMLATTSITVSGTIQNVGPAGGNAAGASGGATANQPCRGGGSARIGTQSAGGSTASGVGVSGALGGTGVGPTGSNGTATPSSGTANYCPAGASGTGTTGGSGGAGVSAGGNAGTGGAGGGTTPNTLANTINDGHTIWAWREPAGTQTFSVCYYGGGGSGGGAGGGNGTQSGGNGGSSGGGGAGGGVVFLSSPTITVAASGVISANGGNGGNGSNGANGQAGGGATGGGGGGAGGTGGPGGFVVLVYHTYSNSGSVTANGGSGGTLGTHGNGTSGGANGNDGNTGLAGKNGVVFQFAY